MKRILKVLDKELKNLEEQANSRKVEISRLFKSERELEQKVEELKRHIKLQKDELFDVKNMYDELLKERNEEKN
jgi:chaperonin cofactor prefoldin